MNILGTQYSLKDRALDIFVSGCKGNPHCEGCHNHLSWDFSQGDQYCSRKRGEFQRKISKFNNLVSKVRVMGGEPLDQDREEILEMLKDLVEYREITESDFQIWLFTRYEIEDVPEDILFYCDYVKTGRYIPELTDDNHEIYGVKLATANQRILKQGIDY